ncbi:3-phenylpropionate/cinnamic acid dioxygenase subunit beta [Pseudomonas sp. NBRC 100443]|uniref:3-phenylpropionate/cinnamic acid dioxygenase subunit beta n=1 Tax=Pseudomonas sp. NBRC 100443 TaxID=1113665 RepID=UPI0025559335|nr:3-phenylpropionate/cinnamic acid dioxygenase subunit beta [Pseudomonas sp. NBRC 100443]
MTDLNSPDSLGKRIATGSDLYNRIHEFLIDEAALLDNFQLMQWLGCLSEDLSYSAPIRNTRMLTDKTPTIDRRTAHFADGYGSISARVLRLFNTKSAWAENPISRTRRFISNLRVFSTEVPGEYRAISYIQLSRSRYEDAHYEVLTGERHDVLRGQDDTFKLARREIILDQAVLGMANLAVFL